MSTQSSFELSANIDHYLAILSKMYAHGGERQKLEIIVNAQVRINGQGLAFHLNRLTGKTYNRLSDWTLEAT